MERALARYLRHHRAAGHSPKTITFYQEHINYFVAFCKANGYSTAMEDLDADTVRAWIEYEQGRELSPATIRGHIVALKAWTRWLVEDEWLERDPLRKIHTPKLGELPKETLSPKDVDRLLEACERSISGYRDRAIIMAMYSTGIRANELTALRIEDINFNTGLITIRKGKGSKVRVVPLGAKCERAIVRYINHKARPNNPHLFLTSEGDPICFSTLRETFRRLEERTGIHANPHKWRHSFAIQYLRSGGRIETLQKILGHTKLDMVLHYARISGVDLIAAHEVADPTKSLKAR